MTTKISSTKYLLSKKIALRDLWLREKKFHCFKCYPKFDKLLIKKTRIKVTQGVNRNCVLLVASVCLSFSLHHNQHIKILRNKSFCKEEYIVWRYLCDVLCHNGKCDENDVTNERKLLLPISRLFIECSQKLSRFSWQERIVWRHTHLWRSQLCSGIEKQLDSANVFLSCGRIFSQAGNELGTSRHKVYGKIIRKLDPS